MSKNQSIGKLVCLQALHCLLNEHLVEGSLESQSESVKEVLEFVSLEQPVSVFVSDPHDLEGEALSSVFDLTGVEVTDEVSEPSGGIIESQVGVTIPSIGLEDVVCVVIDDHIVRGAVIAGIISKLRISVVGPLALRGREEVLKSWCFPVVAVGQTTIEVVNITEVDAIVWVKPSPLGEDEGVVLHPVVQVDSGVCAVLPAVNEEAGFVVGLVAAFPSPVWQIDICRVVLEPKPFVPVGPINLLSVKIVDSAPIAVVVVGVVFVAGPHISVVGDGDHIAMRS